MLPTVLLGDSSHYLGGGAATTVGATAVGPSIRALREHPAIIDRAAASGRASYVWTVDEKEDVDLCRELGVTRQTLYRHVDPAGALREDGRRLLASRGR